MAEAARFAQHMSDEDALMWNIEKDPVLRSTILAVALLDSAPDWDRLRHRIERSTHFIPRLRQRVVSSPFRIAPPRWMAEPAFDLDFHLRRVRLAGPATLRSLFDASAAGRDVELRPGPAALGVHAVRGTRRRPRRVRAEGAPLRHRRRRRHGAPRPLRRSRSRRGRTARPRDTGRDRAGDHAHARGDARLDRAHASPLRWVSRSAFR